LFQSRKLVKNRKLRGLIGGIENVTLGDEEARAEAKRTNSGTISKMKAQRGAEPVFDAIIELYRGKLHEWRIVRDTGKAVDIILDGWQYNVERRVRDPNTGTFAVFEELR
jgi:hypothetical protein